MIDLLFYSLIAGLFSLAGGLLLLWKQALAKKLITPLLSFAAGAFLATGFFDILPEALETTGEAHPILVATVIGFTLFFILERFLMTSLYKHSHQQKSHSDHTESLPFLLILGDSLHNFLDGIIIALTYVANPSLGLVTTIAIVAHEVPQEIGDFSILLNQGWPKTKIILVNIMQSLLTIPGVILGFCASQILEAYLPYFLAAAAGIFIYLGASSLVPELHHKAGHKHFGLVIWPFIISLVIMYLLVSLAHFKIS